MKLFSALFSTAILFTSLSACQSNLRVMPNAAMPMMQAQSTRVIFHVVPESKAGVWHVKLQRNPVAVSTHRTKEQAVIAGRILAKQAALGQLIIHKSNGQIETEYTYGTDPVNSVG